MDEPFHLGDFFGLKQKLENMDVDTLYGFSYISSETAEWVSYAGSFQYIYGVSQGIESVTRNNELDYEASGFFILDNNYEPISMFKGIIINKNYLKHIGSGGTNNVIFNDLSFGYGNVPEFYFEY